MGGEIPWIEKYRPKSLSEIVGQRDIVTCLQRCVAERNIVNMIFAGPSGTGKTSCAIAIAHELYGERWHDNVLELNASDERGIDVVRGKIKEFARTLPIGSVDFKICILDEADALTPDAQQALRRTIEMFAQNTRFILICNYSSKIIEPIQSRCAVFRFSALSHDEIAEMINRIANCEELEIEDSAIDALIEVSEGDMRRAINILQSCAFNSKKISEEEIFKIASRVKPREVKEIVDLALSGNFSAACEKLNALLNYVPGEDIIFQIYREIIERKMSARKKVKLIDKIGEFNFRLTQGANEKIQLTALLAFLASEENF